MKENMEVTFDGGKVITAHINGHVIRTDQPLDNGGGNTAPAPFELFLASIGTCAGIYVKSFCDRREIPTEGIKIIQTMEMDEIKKVPGKISIDIQLPAGFPEKYREAVVSAAELCLVKKTISNQPEFKVMTTIH
jgi:ribosomal protein S12 methylthiotransferase accessory factor